MEFLAAFILVFLALRTTVSLVNLLSGLHLPDNKPKTFPKISILIPARNEEAVLGQLLQSLEKIDYPDYEVIVCDDHSSDNTEEILNWFVGEEGRFHWFLSEKLPDDWLGKNFACHQLAEKASGKYLIFIDADVELKPETLTKAIAFFQDKKLALLSIFPQQHMISFAEKITVPLMNWILQSLLPMILVQKTKFPSLSAANGQFMMFEAENYHRFRWHKKVRKQNVEDILLARMIKTEGFKTAVLLGNKDVFCRMYRKLDDAILGFSRNIHEYFGGNRILLILFWFLILFGPMIVWQAFGMQLLINFLALVILNRLLVALASKQNSLVSVLLHPLQMISFTAIVCYNIYRRTRKDTEWKGRRIKLLD